MTVGKRVPIRLIGLGLMPAGDLKCDNCHISNFTRLHLSVGKLKTTIVAFNADDARPLGLQSGWAGAT